MSLTRMSSPSLAEVYRYAKEIRFQKRKIKEIRYDYKFPHTYSSEPTKVEEGTPCTALCMSAFNSFIENDEDYENALTQGGHHPITGPFSIGTCESRQDIVVCIDDIVPFFDRVWSITRSAGVFHSKFKKEGNTAVERAVHLFPPYLDEAYQSMIGVIGTNVKGKDMGSGRGGSHGGNLDLPYIHKGSVVILPSYRCTTNVWFGDLHAQQGEGELSGIAMECSGMVGFRLYREQLTTKTREPIIIVPDTSSLGYYVFFVGCRATFRRALNAAAENAIQYGQLWDGYGFIDAYKNIGLKGSVVIGQAIGKTVSLAIRTRVNDLSGLFKDLRKDVFTWKRF